ncbi:hypothetical protein FACS1894216_01180 [Synergistales bacterium]|nr:hypothetical protein FACS1894216_01180 [Synergistales bacterium]
MPDNDMTESVTGADGHLMHSLMEQGRTGTVTINLLKTSPVNAQMQQLINSQSTSSATWGDNVISIRDVVRGDDLTISECAFIRQSDVNYAAAGGTMAWTFRGRFSSIVLGAGLQR